MVTFIHIKHVICISAWVQGIILQYNYSNMQLISILYHLKCMLHTSHTDSICFFYLYYYFFIIFNIYLKIYFVTL